MGGHLVHGVVCFILGRVSEYIERVQAAMPAERSPGRAPREMVSVKCLALFVSCVRECVCLNGVRVLDGDVRMVCVRSGFRSEGYLFSWDGYPGALNVLRAWGTERCVL